MAVWLRNQKLLPSKSHSIVGPERVPCEGEGPQECYQVKETPDGEWQLFYDEIEGFEWEPGYEYELLVNVYQVENPPAGGSSLRYELVEVVSKDACGSGKRHRD